jgi:hypothetical protein
VLASDEPPGRRLPQARREGQRETLLTERLPGHIDGSDRLGNALELERADRFEGIADACSGEVGDDLLGEDLAAARTLAQARRVDHRQAEIVSLRGRRRCS